MKVTRRCAQCENEMPAGTDGGLCPKCLLAAGLAGDHLRVRCPHCRNPIEIYDESPLRDITCPSCDSKFSLIEDSTATATHDKTKSIQQYQLVEQVGIGGFGAVWKALDTELHRTVAIKIPRTDQNSATEIEQFLREARAAAQLTHPNIVSVHEVGRAHGQIYIVSEYVDGVTLADWLTSHQTTPMESASLCAHIAAAVHHAHQAGVIHRDLKPSNVMIDERGEPHITDFGLAKRESGEITMTIDGRVLGTPAYMSPEQARGKGHDADARSDVYSLGVILFETLTGEKPFRGTSRMLLHQVIHDDAPKLRRLNGAVPRDLETICLKCLEKDPNRRYQSADALADELRRFLRGEPVQARPISSTARARRWCRRNPLVSGMSAALVAIVMAVSLGSTLAAYRFEKLAADEKSSRKIADQAREKATDQAERSRQQLVHMNISTAAGLMDDGRTAAALPYLLEAYQLDQAYPDRRQVHRFRIGACLAMTPKPVLAWCDPDIGSDGGMAISPTGDQLVTWNGKAKRYFDPAPGAAKLWNRFTGKLIATLQHEQMVVSASFTRNGRHVITASFDGTARIWDASSGRALGEPIRHQHPVWNLDISPDGTRIVTEANSLNFIDGQISIWSVPEGKQLSVIPQTGWVRFSSDGKHVVVNNVIAGVASVWSAESGELVGKKIQYPRPADLSDYRFLPSARLDPSGNHLVISNREETARWDLVTGERKETLALLGPIQEMSPDGRKLVIGNGEVGLRTLDLASGMMSEEVLEHGFEGIFSVRFSPDGRYVLSGAHDRTVRMWNAVTGEPVIAPITHSSSVQADFTPNGRQVITLDTQGWIRIWDLASGSLPYQEIDTEEMITGYLPAPPIISPSQRYFVGLGRQVRIWNLTTRTPTSPSLDLGDEVLHADFSPDESLLATFAATAVHIWEVPSGRHVRSFAMENSYHGDFSANGQQLVAVCRRDPVFYAQVIDVASGEAFGSHLVHELPVRRASFSPSGRLVVTCAYHQHGSDSEVRVWEAATGEPITDVLGHNSRVVSAEFSKDEAQLLTATNGIGLEECSAQLWNVETGKSVGKKMSHKDGLSCATFTADGRKIVTASDDGSARVWDAATGEPITAPMRHRDKVSSCEVSSDQQYVVTSSWDKTARVWDLATGLPVSPPLPHDDRVVFATFSQSESSVITVTRAANVRLWKMTPETRPVDELESISGVISGQYRDGTGSVMPLASDESAAVWQTYQARHAGSFEPSRDRILSWHRREAILAVRHKSWSQAEHHLTEILRTGPRDHGLYARRGHARLMQADRLGAIEDLSRALQVVPDDVVVLVDRANALARLGQYSEAAADYRRALDVTTWWASAGFDVNRLGHNYYAEMRAPVTAACEQNPEDPNGWYCRGRMHMFYQEREQAISALSRCIELAPNDWRALWCRSKTYMRLGKWQEGLADGNAAMGAGADQAILPMYIMLANLKASFRQYEEALADFRSLLPLQPDDNFNWFRMGILLAKLRPTEELRNHCTAAASRFRDSGSEVLARVQLPLALSPNVAIDWDARAAEALRAVAGTDSPMLKAFISLDAGTFKYRAGRDEEALALITPHLAQLPEAGQIRGHAIRAMAHHRLGQSAEAKNALRQSRALQTRQFPETDTNNLFGWENRLMGLIWYDEAAQLIGE